MTEQRTAATYPPMVAILRGVTPDEIIPIAESVYRAGFRYIEVPLNSPNPLESIARLVDHFGDRACCGAGTVTSAEQVEELASVGARLVVSPNCDPQVIRSSLKYDMISMPGFFTPTEAFAAISAGATFLKLYPAASLGADYVKNLKTVLPGHVQLLAVGGISLENMDIFSRAGVDGFGIGGDLYKPGHSKAEVADLAGAYMKMFAALKDTN
ncbi:MULTISPECIES: 2-dehydro-3-deoxy-6-phosphogalactonate aldolase [Microbulbifer]|uniref:2-dehydro-3-deoxy-6-phosphogalactonate aldolase n=1 Tax=Microbulbifer celer TaxID=435905 RepID=A0ABW3U929_9GAMM|nr:MULTISPECIES: 2-dehydro-3-deoxy-6-phosphogalactonate aldolase [Microbulbifer]UFN57527.1 2-dehydro-3-deoxy-6-phosphogalactonate aldolase [Microbulbifer celer]